MNKDRIESWRRVLERRFSKNHKTQNIYLDIINKYTNKKKTEEGFINATKELIEKSGATILNEEKGILEKDNLDDLIKSVDWVLEKEIKVEKHKKKEDDNIIYTSLIINENKNIFAEQVYHDNCSFFCIYNYKTQQISYEDIIIVDDITYKPITDEEVHKGAILLPSKPLDYESDEKLDEDIKNFIKKWLDIPEDFLQFAVWNIKRSWVFERFHTLNYLRARGDTGLGKSRFLDTLGSIHYKPIATSGATTAAPVFRIIQKWRGTLIIDEADFGKSDESQDIIKIINQGYEKNKFVMRCDKENGNKVNFFDPFCPKILATRRAFEDKAVESRCITQIMKGTRRKDILFNLNESFWDGALEIRNKLLMWRFRNYYKIDPTIKINIELEELEPRVQQIISCFISLFNKDEKQMEMFRSFIYKYQEDLIDERKDSFAGVVVGAIHDLLEEGNLYINAADIIEKGELTSDKGGKMNPRSLTNLLKSLGFEKSEVKRTEEGSKRCIPLKPEHLEDLFKRFGYDVTVVTVVMDTRKIFLNREKPQNLLEFSNGGGIRMHRNNRNNVTSVTDIILGFLEENGEADYETIKKTLYNTPDNILFDTLEGLKHEGQIFEPRPGFYQILL